MKETKFQCDRILAFLEGLDPDFQLPDGVSIMNPYAVPGDLYFARQFYRKFYSDNNTRCFVLGMDPGRLAGGITGIPFTDPLKLEINCGTANNYAKKSELSADFIYSMIAKAGGTDRFYRDFFFTAVCPLGFVKDGRNMNYYDDRMLLMNSESFIVDSMKKQLATIAFHPTAFCLGEGTNFRHLSFLNDKYRFFDKIIPLPHPRWVMQYRRKQLEEYIDLYCKKLLNVENGRN